MTYNQIKTELEKFTTKNYKTETDNDGKEYFLVPSKICFYGQNANVSFTKEDSCAFYLSKSDQTISFRYDGKERIFEGVMLMSEISGTDVVYDKIYKQVIEGSNSTIREV